MCARLLYVPPEAKSVLTAKWVFTGISAFRRPYCNANSFFGGVQANTCIVRILQIEAAHKCIDIKQGPQVVSVCVEQRDL